MIYLRPTRAVIDLDALARNFHRLRARLPDGCEPMPVVKADGYGHGAVVVARRLQSEGARFFAVAVVEEGVELRRQGIESEILVMGWIGRDQLPDLLRHRLTPNAHSLEMLRDLHEVAAAHSGPLGLHLKVDTGMTRLGLLPEELPEAIEILRGGNLTLAGLFQNFASADDREGSQTSAQLRVFHAIHDTLAAAGLTPREIHIANSAGTLLPPAWPAGLPPPSRVRPGLAIYGRFPGLPGEDHEDVMSLLSVLDQVKRVPEGTRVGYGGTFTTARETVVGIVPAGYADGIHRSLAGRGRVLVKGGRCPIIGRISMDLTAVDVTDLPESPERGDPVVFFGTHDGQRLGVEELAEAAGTIPWEVLCGVGPRVPRIVLSEGRPERLVSRFSWSGEERLS